MAVTKLLITSRRPFAQEKAFGNVGPYEQLDGIVYFAVDPSHPANHLITDLKLAPQDANGQVQFSADWRLLRPVEPRAGNHRLLFDILNRGRGPVLRNINSALMCSPLNRWTRQWLSDAPGYTVAWCGWQHDVPDAPGLMRIRAPEAVAPEGPISGKIVVTFVPDAPTSVQYLADRIHRAYPTHQLDDQDAVLTEQDHEDAPERIIPRDQWSFARLDNGRVVPDASHVYMGSGFARQSLPGDLYHHGRSHCGCGLLATRDLGSFLKYGAAEKATLAQAISSMPTASACLSGRFLRHFLYLGLNQDEQDRMVFDGLDPTCRRRQAWRVQPPLCPAVSQAGRSPNSQFPTATWHQTDPETAHRGIASPALASRQSAESDAHLHVIRILGRPWRSGTYRHHWQP